MIALEQTGSCSFASPPLSLHKRTRATEVPLVPGRGHKIEKHTLQQAEDILGLECFKSLSVYQSVLNVFGITDTSTECRCSSPLFKLALLIEFRPIVFKVVYGYFVYLPRTTITTECQNVALLTICLN